MSEKNVLFTLLYVVFGAIGIATFCIAIYIYSTTNSYGSATDLQSNLGQFLSGTAGFFISVTSILALIIAFLTQKQQIINQQKEFKRNSLFNRKQSFKDNFFQLIGIYQSTLDYTTYSVPERIPGTDGAWIGTNYKQVIGRLAIQHYYFDFCDKFLRKFYEEYKHRKDGDKRKIFNECYAEFLLEHQPVFGHYFRNVYHLLKYIYVHADLFKGNDMIDEDDKFYANILRAQFSSHELLFIFFNGLSDIALYSEKRLNYRRLLEKYVFFEHLTVSQANRPTYIFEKIALNALLDFYNKESYGENYLKIKESITFHENEGVSESESDILIL